MFVILYIVLVVVYFNNGTSFFSPINIFFKPAVPVSNITYIINIPR